MKLYLGIIIIIAQILENRIYGEETSLELVQIVFRHGARTPVTTYPNDPYQESFWKDYGGFGQLTQHGMQQHYNYGQYLRNRYAKFLNATYSRERVLVMSTDYDRTLMSAYSLLSSLYKPVGFQVWNENITWQPIPVHIGDSKIFLVAETCPRYAELVSEVTKTKEYNDLNNEFKDLIDIADQKSGFKILDLMNLWKMSDSIVIEKNLNLTLPDWVEANYKMFARSQDIGFYFDYYFPEMAQLTSGGILNELRKNILNKTKTNYSRELILFSSHDSYVAALTKLLNLTTYINQPTFTSSVIFELRKSITNSNYYIQVYLKNNTDAQPIDFIELNVYGCDKLCPLEDFFRITDNMIVEDSAKACLKNDQKNANSIFNPTFLVSIGFCAIIAISLSIISISSCRYSIRHSKYSHEQL